MPGQGNYGYTVDMDDFPSSLLPKNVTVDELYRLLAEFNEYFPAAVAGLARIPEAVNGNGNAPQNGHATTAR